METGEKKKINRQARIVIIALIVCVAAIAVLLFLNRDNIAAGRWAQQNATLTFAVTGQDDIEVDYDYICSLPATDFAATIRSSGQTPEEVIYTGVLLQDVLDDLDIDISGCQGIRVYAADGYAIAAQIDDVLDRDNVYLAYKIDGEVMKNRDQGGWGPYQIIIREDSFSQRWAKYVMKIEFF